MTDREPIPCRAPLPEESGDILRRQRQGEAELSAALEEALYAGRLGARTVQRYIALNDGLRLVQTVMIRSHEASRTCDVDRVLALLLPRFADAVFAALRLARGGYFDVAFAPIRVVGELANLLQLFDHDPRLVAQWLEPHGDMHRMFAWSEVVARLERADIVPLFGESALLMFSSAGVLHELSSANELLGHSDDVRGATLESPMQMVWDELVFAVDAVTSLDLIQSRLVAS